LDKQEGIYTSALLAQIAERKLKKWYLAHPYSGDADANVVRCTHIANKLMNAGYWVVAPIIGCHVLDREVVRDSNFWYMYDLKLLDYCDGLVLAPGWETSKGCWLEKGYALGQGKEIVLAKDLVDLGSI
jgi:nucleoside 2-deoxyribosyltransferase